MLISDSLNATKSFAQIFGGCSASLEQITAHFADENFDWLKDLKGGWSFAIKQNTKTILATDQWGTRPLYYTLQNKKLFYSENLDDLFLFLPQVTLNPAALARFLLEDFSHPEGTFFNEIKKLPPGTVLTYTDDSLKTVQWTENHKWEPEKRDFYKTTLIWEKELMQHLSTLLPRHQKWGIFVSGGLDSTGLVALSMELIQKYNWPIQIELYNLTTDHPESHDQGFCQKLADHYQLPLHRHKTTPIELNQLFVKWKKQKSSLPFFPTLQMFEPLMKIAAQNHCTGLLFGYGADEQWTLLPQTLGLDFLINQQWVHFLKTWILPGESLGHIKNLLKIWAQQKCPEPLKTLFQPLQSHGIPRHLEPNNTFKEQKRQLKKRIQAHAENFTSYSQKQLFLRNFISGNNACNLTSHLTMARTYGLNVYFPYLSSEMLNISLQTTSDVFLQAQDKYILRELLKNKLLEEIRTAPKFQDYCQLAFKTSLLLEKEHQDYLLSQKWLKPNNKLHFDDDSFFEAIFAEKLFNSSGGTFR